MRVLVVDVGGTHVKVLATGQKVHRECPSGPTLTAEQMVAGVKTVTADWKYDAVSTGAATSTSWRLCRPAAGPATMRTRFSGGFACGK